MASDLITIVQGSDAVVTLTLRNTDLTALDVSAATELYFAVATAANIATTPTILKKLSAGGIFLTNGGSDGKIDVSLAYSDTLSLNPGNYTYQAAAYVGSKWRVGVAGVFTLNTAHNFTVL